MTPLVPVATNTPSRMFDVAAEVWYKDGWFFDRYVAWKADEINLKGQHPLPADEGQYDVRASGWKEKGSADNPPPINQLVATHSDLADAGKIVPLEWAGVAVAVPTSERHALDHERLAGLWFCDVWTPGTDKNEADAILTAVRYRPITMRHSGDEERALYGAVGTETLHALVAFRGTSEPVGLVAPTKGGPGRNPHLAISWIDRS